MKTIFTPYLLRTLLLLMVASSFSRCAKDSPEPQPEIDTLVAYAIPYDYQGVLHPEYKFLWEQQVYNQEGLLIEEKYRKNTPAKNDVLYTETNTYKEGLLASKEIARDVTSIVQHQIYTYEGDRLTKMDYYFGSSLLETYAYEYKDLAKPSRMLFNHYDFSYDPDIFEYTYDSRGNKIREVIKSNDYSNHPHHHRSGVITWEYDEHNNVTKETFYPNSSRTTQLNQLNKYTYTPEGKVAEEIRHNREGKPVHKLVYTYNSQGLKESVEISQIGLTSKPFEPFRRIEYEYTFKK